MMFPIWHIYYCLNRPKLEKLIGLKFPIQTIPNKDGSFGKIALFQSSYLHSRHVHTIWHFFPGPGEFP